MIPFRLFVFWFLALLLIAVVLMLKISCVKAALERNLGHPVSWRDTFVIGG